MGNQNTRMEKLLNYVRTGKHFAIIATPAFGHQVTTNYANSLLKFVSTSHPRLAVSSAVHMQSGMALVTQARNNCVAYFLNQIARIFIYRRGHWI